jgi:hypothetical protein
MEKECGGKICWGVVRAPTFRFGWFLCGRTDSSEELRKLATVEHGVETYRVRSDNSCESCAR